MNNDTNAVADQGFPRPTGGGEWEGGTNPRSGGKHLLFGNIFAESCMKIIEIGPRGARDPTALLDLPMQIYH